MTLACIVWSLIASSPVQRVVVASEAAEPGLAAAALAGHTIAEKPSVVALADCHVFSNPHLQQKSLKIQVWRVRRQHMLLLYNTTEGFCLVVGTALMQVLLVQQDTGEQQ